MRFHLSAIVIISCMLMIRGHLLSAYIRLKNMTKSCYMLHIMYSCATHPNSLKSHSLPPIYIVQISFVCLSLRILWDDTRKIHWNITIILTSRQFVSQSLTIIVISHAVGVLKALLPLSNHVIIRNVHL